MAKVKISEFSSTPGNNTDIDGINLAEGCAPSGINDAIRELMAQLKDFQTGAAGDSFNGPVGTTTAAAGAFTTLAASGAVTLSGGTANGVAYLNGSKVLTTGSALTFNGTNLFTTGNIYGGTANANANILAYSNVANGGAGFSQFLFANTSSETRGFLSYSHAVDAMLFGVVGSEQMRLTSTGLGIGTSSPGTKLDVAGTARVQSNFFVYGTGDRLNVFPQTAGSGVQLLVTDNANSAYAPLSLEGSLQSFNISGAEAMRLTSTGLGIGTSSPAFLMQLQASGSGTVGPQLNLRNSATRAAGNYCRVSFSPTADFTGTLIGAYIDGVGTTGAVNNPIDLVFGTGVAGSPNEKMRLDFRGNLGLGVTPSAWGSPYKALQVGTTAVFGGNTASNRNYSSSNVFWNGSSYRYITTSQATQFEQSDGAYYWLQAPSGTAGNAISFTQAMTLDASGNLYLGATAGARGGATTRQLVKLGAGQSYVEIQSASTTSTSDALMFSDGATGNYGLIGYNHSSDSMNFYTAAAERARIQSNGSFLIGGTSIPAGYTATRFYVEQTTADYSGAFNSTSSTAAYNYGLLVKYSNAAPNNTANNFLACQDSTFIRCGIRSNGGIANYSANDVNLSDRREKTNFAPAKSYLDTICAIPVQTFNYIDQNLEEDAGLTLGVVAQDVQAVAPELVMESNWGSKEDPKMRLSIYQTDLQYALMKCIQEQQAIIESLKARLDAANL